MAGESSELAVRYSAQALASLTDIWRWNADTYGPDHADAYVAFVKSVADQLSTRYSLGRPVPSRPEYRYINIRRRQRGHGHLAVYRVKDNSVEVLKFFHTAQDWQTRIERGEV